MRTKAIIAPLKALVLAASMAACGDTRTLTLRVTGAATIVSEPPGISCTGGPLFGACEATFPVGTAVHLTQPHPDDPHEVFAWDGDCEPDDDGSARVDLSWDRRCEITTEDPAGTTVVRESVDWALLGTSWAGAAWLSPDGTRLRTFGVRLREFEVTTGRAVQDRPALPREIGFDRAEFSSDGSTIAVLSPDGLRFVDFETGSVVYASVGSRTLDLAISADGSAVVVREPDVLRLVHRSDPSAARAIPTGDLSRIDDFRFHPNGNLLLLAGGEMRIYVGTDGRRLVVNKLALELGAVSRLSPTGAMIASQSTEGIRVAVASLIGTWRALRMKCETPPVWSADGKQLACLDGRTFRVASVSGGVTSGELIIPSGWAWLRTFRAGWSSTGIPFAIRGSGWVVWDVARAAPSARGVAELKDARWLPDGSGLVALGAPEAFRLSRSGVQEGHLGPPTTLDWRTFDLDPGTGAVLFASLEGLVRTDPLLGDPRRLDVREDCSALAFDPSGSRLARARRTSFESGGRVTLSGPDLAELAGADTKNVAELVWDPLGATVLAVGDTPFVFDADSGKSRPFPLPLGARSVQFGAGGSRVFGCAGGRALGRTWPAGTPDDLAGLAEGACLAVAATPWSGQVAVVSPDGVHLVDASAATDTELARFDLPGIPPDSASVARWSPDARRLAVVTTDALAILRVVRR